MTNPESIVDRLQPFLQQELNDTGVRMADTPVSLTGGNETELFRIRLAGGPVDLPEQLVLRIYPESVPGSRAKRESIMHNCLRDMGLPVPIVYFTGEDTSILGAPFIIMELMPGRPLIEGGLSFAAEMLGSTQARLHDVDAAVLADALGAQGIDVCDFYPEKRLSRLAELVPQYPWAAEAVQWLCDHLPPQPDKPVICHNDFHLLNLLEEDGEVTAILDWSNFGVGEPIMDVAFTVTILTVTASQDYPDTLIESLMAQYRAAYTDVRPMDMTHFDYFRALRATMALYEGAWGQVFWKQPQMVERLTALIKSVSGVEVSPPQ